MFAFESAITKTRDIESRSLSKLRVAIPFSETLADVSARVIYNKIVYCKVTRFWGGKARVARVARQRGIMIRSGIY